MAIRWNEEQPIFRQLEQHIKSLILDEAIKEGEALPSVRVLAAEFTLNPLTVSKALQELVQQRLIEKRRGLGMFVCEGAKNNLLQVEREKFLQEEWPKIKARIERLGLNTQDILKQGEAKK